MPSTTSWVRNLTTPAPISHQYPHLPRPTVPSQHSAEFVNTFATHHDQPPPHFQVQNNGWYPNVGTARPTLPQQSYRPANGGGHTNRIQYPGQMPHHHVMAQRHQPLEHGYQVVQALRPLPLPLAQGEGHDRKSNQSKSIAEDDISKPKVDLQDDEWDPNHWTAGLHCSVCFEFHTESYVLQCGHTWCNGCIEAMMKSEKQRTPRRPMDYIPVVCPSCRHSQPYGQYSHYAPRNRALEEAVDAWRKSPDRAKLLAVKDDIGVQVDLDLDDLERKGVPPPKAMSVQTEERQPKKTYMSIGHQVSLPAEGSTVATQTTCRTRDADVQTTPTKQRTKCTQTMFTKTRASGVQVGPPGGFQNPVTTLTPPESTSSTPQPSTHTPPPTTPRPAAPSPTTATPPVSPSNAALGNLIGSLLDRSESAAAILTLTPPPTPPSTTSSNSKPASATRGNLCLSRTKAKRWRNRRKKEAENKVKKALFSDPGGPCTHEEYSLEDFLGDDLADVVRPIMGFDVTLMVALAFHLVCDWRHLLSTVVTDVPTIGPGPYYTSYTIDVMGDAIFVWCLGALGFLYGAMVFLRDAGCWLLEKI